MHRVDPPEHDPVLWEEGAYEQSPESCYARDCTSQGMMWKCTSCDTVCCEKHSVDDGGCPPSRHCEMCHATLDDFAECGDAGTDLRLPLRPCPCPCVECGDAGGRCIFNTWSRVPAAWSGRLCFDCTPHCVCPCSDPVVQRREKVLKKVDEAAPAAAASVNPSTR